jgi:hypothetical protein
MVPISFAFLVIFMQASYSVILVDPSNRVNAMNMNKGWRD